MCVKMDEMRQIIMQIMQDGAEKAEEIDIKCEEEFQAEKWKLLSGRVSTIDQKYRGRMDTASMNQAISESRLKNKARLSVLAKKMDFYDELVSEAKKELRRGKDSPKYNYKKLLKDMIVQGLCMLYEKTVFIRCRPRDRSAVYEVLQAASSEFFQMTQLTTKLVVDRRSSLPDTSFGGVILLNESGSISLNNTLDWRLEDVAQKLLPFVITTLFVFRHKSKSTK